MTDQMPHTKAPAEDTSTVTECSPYTGQRQEAMGEGPAAADSQSPLADVSGGAPDTAPEAGALPHLDGCEQQLESNPLKEEQVPAVTLSADSQSPIANRQVEGRSESELTEGLRRMQLLAQYEALIRAGYNPGYAAEQIGVSRATISRWRRPDGVQTKRHHCGRRADLDLTEAEVQALQKLYLDLNKDELSGSMRSAAKFFALDVGTREEVKHAILSALAANRIPGAVRRALERVTRAHVSARRRPKLSAVEHFSGNKGAFVGDKIERRRVIEADDGTLNFACWIPWPMGGDPCSDKFQVRLGRWQFLPAIEAGWSNAYLGYALVCRPRGSYRDEDIRALIHLVGRAHGLPDVFRFEMGSWKSNAIVNLLEQLGVQLTSVHQPNQKPFVESGFNTLWTYMGHLKGQMGRYRGEMEEENRLAEKCKAGRADPREHFMSLSEAIAAIDGALAMRNSDTHKSIYGSWVPEVRLKDHALARPWKPLPRELSFLFAPYVREWTVTKGSVGGMLPLLDDGPTGKVPFYFASDDLWLWNGKKVRLYFDPAAEQCMATIVSLGDYHGFRKGEVICRAELCGDLPHHARACFGWGDEQAQRINQSIKIARAACMRQVRALTEAGQIKASVSEARDGGGNVVRVTRTGERQEARGESSLEASGGRTEVSSPSRIANSQSPIANGAPSADAWARRRARLAEDAAAARELAAQRNNNNNTEEQ